MRSRYVVTLLLAAGAAFAQTSAQTSKDTPLFTQPYTPSLDVPSMDQKVDPCVDFYRYSCGGWIKNNPIPPDQAIWNVYSKLQEENERFLWGVLEEASKDVSGRTAVQREVGDYFHACMDEAAGEKAGAAPLKPELEQIAALRSPSDIAAYLGHVHQSLNGPGMLFGFGSNQDFQNSTQVIAFAFAGGLGLPDRDYYTNADAKSQEKRARYVEHVGKMFELLGDSPATAKANAQTVMSIETALAKASLTRVERRDPYKLYHRMTRAELRTLTPAFNWDAYFTAAAAPSSGAINVTEPDFFKAVQKLIEQRPLSDWQTYFRWHAAHAAAPYLSSQFVAANFDFYSHYLRGVAQMQPRWKRCVQWVDRDLGEALGQVFADKTFGPDVKARTVAMTRQIESAMEAEIGQLPWMSEATKRQALEKLHGVVNKIGYPDKWRDYSSIRLARDDFAGNVRRATMFESKRQLAKIGKPVDHGEWQMTPPTVNAYYDPQMNDINFPAGVLQPPLFDAKMDDAPNFGNTGATIGHELTHGFDDEGRQFDAKGNLHDWWTPQDAQEFQKRADCVSTQYSGYTIIDDIKINGKLTLGEDVADLGGTLLAYIAWKNATQAERLEPVGGFTPDQRFFIGMAQWACGDERPENKRANAITNPHSPDQYRINGVVSNLPQFAAAFSCKAGQPMVRPQPCKIW